jgi:ketosteroid isomerase-like protein
LATLFVQHLNSGDLEAVAALYAPNARFLARSGETIGGGDRIRDMLARMIRSKTKFTEPGDQADPRG